MVIIDRFRERLQIEKQDSDATAFTSLLYFGEMLYKIVVGGMVACVDDSKERNQYYCLYRLVRADGLGEWGQVLHFITIGPGSQFITTAAREELRQLTQNIGPGLWQYEMVSSICSTLDTLSIPYENISKKVSGKQWFDLFGILRNKTRGHGAVTTTQAASAYSSLFESIEVLINNFNLFKRQWAYLHRNLSGKYRISGITENVDQFDELKTSVSFTFPNGIYLSLDGYLPVNLIQSNAELTDFYFANGQFRSKDFEMLSYITNDKISIPNSPYLTPVESLPQSETQGASLLDAIGNCFSNLPSSPPNYIARTKQEEDVISQLKLTDRHPIVTLTGPGGIGKTTLAIKVLHQLVNESSNPFSAIIWLSARDIDLLPTGPKLVRAHVVSIADFAKELVNLLQPKESQDKSFKAEEYLSSFMATSPIGPTLFVFDNFETVSNPREVFRWIDTYIRSPNKILITTRIRDFKADFPIYIGGMTENESYSLIDSASKSLNIEHLVDTNYKDQVYRESGGHPYVMKILVGESAKAGHQVKPERIVADQDEILIALFERTFIALSPTAQRVFLLLCNWRSVVPELALEAVVLRPENERMNVSAAIYELAQFSFLELLHSEVDNQVFLYVPLAAMTFGKKKLAVSVYKAAVEADSVFLQYFGAAQKEDVRRGLTPRIDRLIRKVAQSVSCGAKEFNDFKHLLEFLARKVPVTWLDIAQLAIEIDEMNLHTYAKECVRRFLESPDDINRIKSAWYTLADICKRSDDLLGELQAIVEIVQLNDVTHNEVSNATNRINDILRRANRLNQQLPQEEKGILLNRVLQIFRKYQTELDATACSRLAWLYLNIDRQNVELARECVEVGLSKDQDNIHCKKLQERLSNNTY